MSFAERLAQSRKRAGKTQRAVAEAMGVSVQAVSQWENGLVDINPDRIAGLAGFLNVSEKWLKGGVDGNATLRPQEESGASSVSLKAPISDAAVQVYRLKDIPSVLATLDKNEPSSNTQPSLGVIYTKAKHNESLFAVMVEGDVLSPDLNTGDVAIFSPRTRAEPGDIVVSLVSYTNIFQFGHFENHTEQFSAAIMRMGDLGEHWEETMLMGSHSLDRSEQAWPAVMIFGPMIERRIYRVRRHPFVT